MSIQSFVRDGIVIVGLVAALGCGSEGTASGPLGFAWPPGVGETYPDVTLRDTNGAEVSLASFRGKVLLIEPIGMT